MKDRTGRKVKLRNRAWTSQVESRVNKDERSGRDHISHIGILYICREDTRNSHVTTCWTRSVTCSTRAGYVFATVAVVEDKEYTSDTSRVYSPYESVCES